MAVATNQRRRPFDAHRVLRGAVVFFVFGVVVHTADHFRRGTDVVSAELFWLGTAALVVDAVVVALVFTRHRLAPLATVIYAVPRTLGILAFHFLPEWTVFSDPFVGSAPAPGVTGLSWIAALVEVAGAIGIAAAAIPLLRSGPAAATSR